MKTFEKELIIYNNSWLAQFRGGSGRTLLLCVGLSKFFKIFHPSGLPLSPHLLCCRAFAVNYYSFTPCASQLRRNRQLQILGINQNYHCQLLSTIQALIPFVLILKYVMASSSNSSTKSPNIPMSSQSTLSNKSVINISLFINLMRVKLFMHFLSAFQINSLETKGAVDMSGMRWLS